MVQSKRIVYILCIGLFTAFIAFLSHHIKDTEKCPHKAENGENRGLQASEVFHIRNKDDGTIITVSEETFLYGAITTEMPLTYEKEALKAQAVAISSVYGYLREKARNNGQSFDFSCSPTHWQIYVTQAEMKARWQSQFATYDALLREIGSAVGNQVLRYNGEIAMTAFHAISSGQTENAALIWGGEFPYLSVVDSHWDTNAKDYRTVVSVTRDDFSDVLEKAYPNCFVGINGRIDRSAVKRTASGTVLSLQVNGQVISGEKMRSLFGLRSADFSLSVTETDVIFTVLGYGHGVGMSQFGANEMAKLGYTYREILTHYYPGTVLSVQ